jgi:hypothetical protein
VADRFIALESTNLAPALAAEVRTDFATELRHRGLDVCDPAVAERDPAALVRVEGRDDVAIIELDDRVTHKRVGRDLSLRGIPANGRALAIAIAIDELLRASWAELTLTRRRAKQGDEARGDDDREDEEEDETGDGYVPTRRGTISARARARQPTRYQLGVDLGYLHTQHNFEAFSLGARSAVRPWGLGWFELSVAAVGALPADSRLGEVIAAGFRSTLTAGVCSRQDKPAHGCVGARAGVSLLSFRGLHPEMARAGSELGMVVDTSLLGQLGARLTATLTLFAELGVGAVLRGAKATNGLDTVMGVTGLLLSANVGLGFDL